MYLSKTSGNIASICKIEVIQSAFIVKWPNFLNGIVDSDPVLLGGDWEEIYFTEDTAHLTTREIFQDGSRMLQTDLKFRAPMIRRTNTQEISTLTKQKLVFKLTMLNGTIVLLGSLADPARLNPDLFDFGESARDSNHYALSVTKISKDPSPLVY
jgi:hypothetical protein